MCHNWLIEIHNSIKVIHFMLKNALVKKLKASVQFSLASRQSVPNGYNNASENSDCYRPDAESNNNAHLLSLL